MSEAALGGVAAAQGARRPSAVAAAHSWAGRYPLAALGLALTGLGIAVRRHGPNATAPARRLTPPGAAGYLLGSDQLGRDLLSRLVWGARVSLSVAALAAVGALAVGGTIGLVAGYAGGLIDNLAMRLIDVL